MTATPFPFVVWAALLLTVAAIDAGAYLVAAGRAQGAADAAALAAVAGDDTGAPASRAARVADANQGRLEACRCRPASGRAQVTVSTEVHGLFIPRVNGMRRVTATAAAQLTHPPGVAHPSSATDPPPVTHLPDVTHPPPGAGAGPRW